MKKIIFIIITIIIAFFVYINVNASVDEIIIPDAAIRVRVVANSNSLKDQSMKIKVKEYIERELSFKLLNVDNIDVARNIISNEINQLSSNIQDMFNDNEYGVDFIIHYGNNYFPEKEYKNIHYRAGAYESLVVVIGEGKGDNWWCVLFPPLCLLEADDNNANDIEYQFFVEKMLNKIFH